MKQHPFAVHVNAPLASMLEGLGLDKAFVRGSGSMLYDAHGQGYLDFTAAFGALPFGHNPPEIWEAMANVRLNEEPNLAQPSLLNAAGELAARLVAIAPAGLAHVTFANSGAEAIEAAIKLARGATGRMGILSTKNGFHGKTLGALSATGRTVFQTEFGAPVPHFHKVPYGDIEALEATLATHGHELALFLLEPIQGEGGIVVAPAGYLEAARRLCESHGVLLGFDEVQTGLGRTGKMFGCEHDGVTPDIMTLAKALGGGLMPVAAVLYNDRAWNEAFVLKHTSTFAGGTLACRVGLRVLDLLTENNSARVQHVAQTGATLRRSLDALQARFPHFIRQVRGRGFLQGVELTRDGSALARSGWLKVLAGQGNLAHVLWSYLLNVEHIRLAPAVLRSYVLRIEPPLNANANECARVVGALERALQHLEASNAEALMGHLIGPAPLEGMQSQAKASAHRPEVREGLRWGFIAHPLEAKSLVGFDASLRDRSPEALMKFVRRLRELPKVDGASFLHTGTARILSSGGDIAVTGDFISVPYTAKELLVMPRAEAVAHVREGVLAAKAYGAQLVGLGAFTSIVTNNGLELGDVGVNLTTGNGFTAVSTVDTLRHVVTEKGKDWKECRVAVVGASGSVGRACALLLAREVGALALVGNPENAQRSLARLQDIGRQLLESLLATPVDAPGAFAAVAMRAGGGAQSAAQTLQASGRLQMSVDPLELLRDADVILFATSSTNQLLPSDVPKNDAVVCDVSAPGNVGPEFRAARPDVTALAGGLIALPNQQELGFNVGIPRGLVYACMAETLVLSMANHGVHGSMGTDIPLDHLLLVRRLAQQYGFHPIATQPRPAQKWGRRATDRTGAAPRVPAEPEPATLPSDVRPIERLDMKGALATLTEAFEEDPILQWLLHQGKRRGESYRQYFEHALVKPALPHGLALTHTSGAAVALWTPPNAWEALLTARINALPHVLRASGMRRFPRAMALLDTMRRAHPSTPHYYLANLAVSPDQRGKGLSSKVVKPVLAMCDAQGIGAYLENSNERYLAMYQHHGFVVIGQLQLPKGAPPCWMMWRDPRRGATARSEQKDVS